DGEAIHDPTTGYSGKVAREPRQLLRGPSRGAHGEVEGIPVHPPTQHLYPGSELAGDISGDPGVRRGRGGQHGHLGGKGVDHSSDPAVIGSEVMPPIRYAMG